MYTAVGEGGPEIAYLRGGERIYPHGVIPYDLQRLGITSAIKGYASGIASAPSGAALVGERGTEIVGLGGSRGGAVNNYYDVRIDADRIQELNDIVRIAKDTDEGLEGKDVIIVEDIVDSGRTLSYLLDLLQQRNPNTLKLTTLLDKPDRRVREVYVDYEGFVIPDKFVVGYGLDYAQRYRNLPYIGVISFEE